MPKATSWFTSGSTGLQGQRNKLDLDSHVATTHLLLHGALGTLVTQAHCSWADTHGKQVGAQVH